MNFLRFSASTTNIFPIANTVRGGQLMSEFNLRSREGVGVGPHSKSDSVEYMIGPSYVHSEMDFYCRPQMDGIGLVVEPGVIEILPGRGVINGHYIENLAPMLIDLRDANTQAKQAYINGEPGVHGPELKGDLIIGLRAMYSTIQTLAGTVKPENSEEMYQGFQVVILPPATGVRTPWTFNLPVDVPKDPNLVTAHIELARFHYSNGRITGANTRNDSNPIVNNYPGKSQFIDGTRVFNFEQFIDDVYLKKTGLHPDKIYAMAGRGAEEQATWDDITSNLFVWDRNPDPSKVTDPMQALVGAEAEFVANIPAFKGKTKLVLPRKQVEGMQDSHGNRRYYLPKIYDLPLADFIRGTAGTVDEQYTNQVKRVLRKIHNLSTIQTGKQRAYQPRLVDRTPTYDWMGRGHLPVINNNWRPGDYVMVGEDETMRASLDMTRSPSTLYPLIPGIVYDIDVGKPVGDLSEVPWIVENIQQGLISPGCSICGCLLGTAHATRCSFTGNVRSDQIANIFRGTVSGTTTSGTAHNHIIFDSMDTIYQDTHEAGAHVHRVMEGGSAHQHEVRDVTHEHRHSIIVDSANATVLVANHAAHTHSVLASSSPDTSPPLDNNPEIVKPHIHSLAHAHVASENAIQTHLVTPVSHNHNVQSQAVTHTHRHEINTSGAHGHDTTEETGMHTHRYQLPVHNHLSAVEGKCSYTGIVTTDAPCIVCGQPKGSTHATGEDGHTHNLTTMAVTIGSGSFGGTITAMNEPYVGVEIGRITQEGQPPLSDSAEDKVARRALFGIPERDKSGCPICSSGAELIRGIIGQDYVVYEDTSIPFRKDLPRNGLGVYRVTTPAQMRNNNLSSGILAGSGVVQAGDLCIVSSTNEVYVLNNTPASNASNWELIDKYTTKQLTGSRFFWFRVIESGPNIYGDPILLTGEMPVATEQRIGGFLNVEATALDQGYVRMNDEGHLQLIDYGLLRSGALAYQLGEDFSTPVGVLTQDVQVYLNEYINQRVAFPNWNQQQYADDPNVIHIYLNLSEDGSDINIYDVDSRFNTSIFIHINGNGGENTVINISDCAKVRIDPNICNGEKGPVVNLYRSCLYYDAEVLNRLNIIHDMSLWYEKFDDLDPDILIDGMTVREVGSPIIPTDTKEYNYWEINTPNDNHFQSALRSLTFGKDGTIIGWEVLVKNDSTANVECGDKNTRSTKIFSFGFTIPQGVTFSYPTKRIKNRLKVTGNFVNAYPVTERDNNGVRRPYIVLNTSFTILSNVYDATADGHNLSGTISFFQDAIKVDAQDITHTASPITGWDSGEFHIFRGGSLQ